MTKVQEFINENNLQWQASFNDKTDNYNYGYRGSLVITPGKVLSADKQLPPKATATQVILVSNSDKIDFIACELETLDFFEPFVQKYKEVLSPDGLYLLFVTDLDGDGKFEYENELRTVFISKTPHTHSPFIIEIPELVELCEL